MQPHRGPIILVLGILGFIVCQVFAPIAWFMGSSDLKAMEAGRMDPTGKGLTQAGVILGIIGTVIIGLGVIVLIIMMVIAAIGVGVSTQH